MRRRGSGDKGNGQRLPIHAVGRLLLDFALPARCAGCGQVTEEVGAFCPPCWSKIEWLGNSGCKQCGLPLAGTEIDNCGRCLAQPPLLDRIRAAVAYDDLPRSIALKLKYGRKVALGPWPVTCAAKATGRAVIVPVPLHRWRLWGRGFNQSALVAREVARRWGLHADATTLRRVKSTRPLKGSINLSGARPCPGRSGHRQI